MGINIERIKELRESTGAGVLDVKKALESTGGDAKAAAQLLREKGLDKAAKKATREARQGRVASYIHGDPGRIGVLLEVNCETDFVARTEAFQTLVHDLSMQVAATSPTWARESDVPPTDLEAQRAKFREEMAALGKPAEILGKIVDGKMAKWLDETVLYRQPFIRDQDMLVGDVVVNAIAEIGENIVVRRFARFELGEKV